MKSVTYSIRARANCGVKVTLEGIYPRSPDQCNVTLKFSDGTTMDESSTGKTVTSTSGPIFFDIYSDCDLADVVLFYQEDCRSTTATSTDQSTVSTPQTTTTSESTVSRSPSSGMNVVAHVLPVTFALILSTVQYL
ncbi:unnamed protein product [Calicophoron daubneyi]|uniref:Uncharacterized protein n=1 Tax=Calicophoron daubneyi TaxID=300641 RepID=A0AAV2T661_CALDB